MLSFFDQSYNNFWQLYKVARGGVVSIFIWTTGSGRTPVCNIHMSMSDMSEGVLENDRLDRSVVGGEEGDGGGGV